MKLREDCASSAVDGRPADALGEGAEAGRTVTRGTARTIALTPQGWAAVSDFVAGLVSSLTEVTP